MKLHNIFGAICVLGAHWPCPAAKNMMNCFLKKYHCVLNIKDAGIRNIELYTTDAERKVCLFLS